MSSLYLHIPFCKKACHYCDFHFTTNLSKQQNFVDALCAEIALQKDYLGSEKTLQSIYFGGGTPSLLTERQLEQIFNQIATFFSFDKQTEITLEANPDDLDKRKLQSLQKTGINRLSIGVQSFDEEHLQWMNRSHTSEQATNCILYAQDTGFENLSIDLIYAIPAKNHDIWKKDLQQVLDFGIKHISSYCLTIEVQTPFGHWLKKGKIKPIDEVFALEQFELLVKELTLYGFEQYEISNFAQTNAYSRHNTNYWKKGNYLGLGASAHSYNGKTRQYNIKNNHRYIQGVMAGKVPFEKEQLSTQDHINEYIMTSLRTQWGTDTFYLKKQYNYNLLFEQKNTLNDLIIKELVVIKEGVIYLTPKGKFLADEVTLALFLV